MIQNAFAAAPTASLSRSQTLAAESPEFVGGTALAAGAEVRRSDAGVVYPGIPQLNAALVTSARAVSYPLLHW